MERKITTTLVSIGTTSDGHNYEDYEEQRVEVYFEHDQGGIVANVEGKVYTIDAVASLLEDMKYLDSKV